MEKFTKIYKTERGLLRKTSSVNAYEVYLHLKDSNSYYKGYFYDLIKCVAEYLDIPERSVKDAIKRLKEVGLIEVSKKGKVNVYKLPYANEKVEKQDKKEVASVKEKANQNKGDFRPEIPKDNIRVQQDIESVSNRLKIGKNEVLQIPSDVMEKIGDFANNDSIPIDERYGNISRLLKPYSRNIPTNRIHDYVKQIYEQVRRIA